MKRLLLAAVGGLGVLALATVVALQPRSLAEHQFQAVLGNHFDAWAEQQQQQSRDAGAWPTAVERLERYGEHTDLAFVYIHGFGSSRGEGEWLMEQLSETYQANTWYMRLPGHGTTMEDHARQTHLDYLDAAVETLLMSQLLGDEVVLVGCSTGGLIATHLAATYPELVDGLILGSPYYALKDPLGFLLDSNAGLALASTVFGQPRDASFTGPRRMEGYEDVWLETQDWNALRGLSDLRRYVMARDPVPRVKAPTLMIATPDDTVIDPIEVRAQFDRLPDNPANAFVLVEDSNHVPWSSYIRTNKAPVTAAVDAFATARRWKTP